MGLRRMQVLVLFLLFLLTCYQIHISAQELASDWLQGIDLGIESAGDQFCDGSLGECDEFMMDSEVHGRLLRQIRYYISYGALAANRVPCPPRSGRSYYTRNCYRARGPVRPYHRGCTAITRCRRYTS